MHARLPVRLQMPASSGMHQDADRVRERNTYPSPTGAIKRNSDSLTNQLDIHLILVKQENWSQTVWQNQLGKNRNLAKLTSPRVYMRALIVVTIDVSLYVGG
jgi:hypothetical protein